MVNPFVIDPDAGDRSPELLQGLGRVIGENRKEREAMERKEKAGQALQGALQRGDLSSIQSVIAEFPEISQQAVTQFGLANKQTEDAVRMASAELMTETDPAKAAKRLREAEFDILSKGGKPEFISKAAERLESGDAGELDKIKQFAVMAGFAKAPAGGVKYEQGKGDLKGYAFNLQTGRYSIDPALKEQLRLDAQELASKEMLSVKDVAGVNDKITGLTKDVRGIAASASSLEGLEDSASAAAQLAAVFKFMKALDPTSVVREGEQDQAVKTGGITDQFLGYINQIQGEGRLSSDVLADLTNTAKNLANSAIESSRTEVDDYLAVIEDNLTPKQRNTLYGRIPEMFEVLDRAEPESDEDILRKYGGI